MMARTIKADENTSAATKDPVAPTIAPVTIGPTTPPIFDTEFCTPATIDTMFFGATSAGNAQTWEAAIGMPGFGTHSNTPGIPAQSAEDAQPLLDGLRSPAV